MKISCILVLLVSVLLFGCAKEDGVGITHFSGNDIDSVVQYSLTANWDTVAVFARKFTYSEDKKITNEQWYERIEGQENLIPTIFKSYQTIGYTLIITEEHSDGIITKEYKFNSNHFPIRYVKSFNNSPEYDSVFYQYDDNNYLYSIKSIRLNNSGEFPYRIVSNYYYKWVDGNLHSIVTKEYRHNELIASSNINFKYGTIKNPIDYNCNYLYPYLRYGRASKNLVEKMEYLYNGSLYEQTYYSYLLFPGNKSFLEKSYRENYQTLTKIFYK